MKMALSIVVFSLLALAPVPATPALTICQAARSSTENGLMGADSAAEARRLYDSGMSLFEAGKFEDAIDVFRKALKIQPDDPQTHFSLGMAYSQSKAYKEAADSFRMAVKFKPDWPEANFRAGIMSYVLGRRSQSVEAYNRLLKLDSPLANTLYRIIREDKSAVSVLDSLRSNDLQVSKSAEPSVSAPAKEGVGNAPDNDSPPKTPEGVSKPGEPADNSETLTDRAELTGIYRVGVGDILDVRLLNSPKPQSTLYTVIDGGLIDLPVAGGPMAVGGLTTLEIQSRVVAELRRRAVVGDLEVAVGVRQYSSHPVIVTGLVGYSGTRFLRREAVPLYVIMAEVQPRLNAGQATIMRRDGGGQTVDLGDSQALNTLVRSGDVINVTARPQEFYYIGGRVAYPGQKSFQPGITLLQAVLAAGGLARQNDKHIELSRAGADGRLTTFKYDIKEIKSGKVEDPELLPGDRIEILH